MLTESPLPRRQTRQIHIGPVAVGGGAPVSVQSMTNTPTSDVEATVGQILSLQRAGCEIVRVAVPDRAAADALAAIVAHSPLPVVADIHFDYRLALAALEAGVAALRINPGNIGKRERVEAVVNAAKTRRVPIRIGVNAGSLEKPLLEQVHTGKLSLPEAMVESAIGHIRILENLDFHEIKVSLKASDVVTTVRAYRFLAERFQTSQRDYPFHVGVTETGTVRSGTVKSCAGIGILLMDGLCDTIRVSLTGPVEEEVWVGRRLLQSMGLRHDGPDLISCPTCGRTTIDLYGLAAEVERILEPIRVPLRIAVMGCEVNGPGEAREADLGIAGGHGRGILFRKGKIVRHCAEQDLLQAFREELDAILSEKSHP